MSRVVHFEIHCDNPERAVRFYSEVFGWKISRWGEEPYWLASTGDPKEPGIDGALTPRASPAASTVITVQVASLEQAIEQIGRSGGRVTTPKQAVPGVGWIAYAQDSEGNSICVLQADPNAR